MEHERLKKDQLVELLDQYSNVYPLSPTGARGWVRALRDLPKFDPEAYIEWDKTHWRYHGEKDGWTFEHHFRPVNDEVPDPHQEALPDMETILEEAHRKVDAERCPGCGGFHDPNAAFIDTLVDAQEAALGSDGYFTIVIAPRAEGNLTVFEPQIFTEHLNETARKMLETQLVHIATQLYEAQILAQLREIEGQNFEPGR